jgi:hypothetical protein
MRILTLGDNVGLGGRQAAADRRINTIGKQARLPDDRRVAGSARSFFAAESWVIGAARHSGVNTVLIAPEYTWLVVAPEEAQPAS